jgi:hypothetical protein
MYRPGFLVPQSGILCWSFCGADQTSIRALFSLSALSFARFFWIAGIAVAFELQVLEQ